MTRSSKPTVLHGALKTETEPIWVGSAAWFAWLTAAKKFAFRDNHGKFVARSEMRRNNLYWYAERRRAGKLTKLYLGKSEDLTLERLEQISRALAGTHGSPTPAVSAGSEKSSDPEPRIDTSFNPLAKITAPMLPHQLVSRTRLNRQINTPLTLIHAPSGFGKSTLLNDWKQNCGFPVAWLTLEERDNNLARFWYSVLAAIQVVDLGFGKELSGYLANAAALKPAEIVFCWVNDITHDLEQVSRLGIILDDFHQINQSEIYDCIQILLEHFPAKLQLVISGHTRPPLSVGGFRARGLLTELDINDLRFSSSEGVFFLKQYQQGPPIAYDDLEKLVKHSEGWAAGLTLSALALAKQEDRRQFIDTFSGAHIYMREYFMEMVFQRCTAETQSFLLRTAILKNLHGDLCNTMTGQTNGEEMLARLWQENLFVVRLEKQGWYRYHDLFAEMLVSQLRARFSEDVPALHLRASQWYKSEYAMADAIYHLLVIEAWEDAAALIEEMALRELEQFGEDSRLLRWLQELPESVVQKHKNLLFVYMRLANLALPQSKIEKFVAYIETSLSSKPVISQTPDERDVLSEIHQIRQIWSRGHAFIPPIRQGNDYDARWDLLNRLYLLRPAYRQYQSFPEEPIAELLQEAQESHNLFVILMAGGVLAKRVYFAGQIRRSEKICRGILELAAAQRGKLPETASIALEVLSLLHYERNEIEAAQRYLARAVDVDPNPTSTNMPIHFAILRAKIQLALNQNEEALATIKTARSIQMKRPGGLLENEDLLAYEALIRVRVGETAAAEDLMVEAEEASGHHLLRQVQAEIYLKNNRFEDAEKLLTETIDCYSRLIVIEPLLETRIFLALALSGQHKINQALQVLTEAIRLAGPEHFIRPFLSAGIACAPLLSLTIEIQNLPHELKIFIKELIRLLTLGGEMPAVTRGDIELLSTSASITAREQDILKLLNGGHSNREIALKLSISESTVKSHLGNIYHKLDASSRGFRLSVELKQLKLLE